MIFFRILFSAVTRVFDNFSKYDDNSIFGEIKENVVIS